MKRKLISALAAMGMVCSVIPANVSAQDMYQNSDFIEKEQPELSDETKRLISLYQRDNSEGNYLNLRDAVITDYNAVLDRKETKLAELRTETAGKPGGDAIVDEMEEIVQDMYITYWNRINSSMLRFTDSRLLKWSTANASKYEYIPVMGAGNSIYVKYTPVTNSEYAQFVSDTGYAPPSNWTNAAYPDGEDDYPVNYISYYDAKAYCDWLTEKDGVNVYRLPNESEWELAAGHMPKDADFNCGVNDSRTSVFEYEGVTRGAHGAIDFWGNVWEWTSTERSSDNGTTILGVKGGSWSSDRTDCRTEYRKEGRNASEGYEDVGFRVFQVLNGEEPEQKVELATLDGAVVTGSSLTPNTVTLSWDAVDRATEYQIFEYDTETGLLRMLDHTAETSVTMTGLEGGKVYSYIVQPISYTEIADNVSPENAVSVLCSVSADSTAELDDTNKIGVKDVVFNDGNVSFTVTGADGTNAVLITASYNAEGTLVSASLRKVSLSETGAEISSEHIGETEKLFIWDENMQPLCNAILLEETADESPTAAPIVLSDTAYITVCQYNGLNCLLYTPANAEENMPLIVYLHGVNGKGDDPNLLLTSNELPGFLSGSLLENIPAYILMPQILSSQSDWLSIKETVVGAINEAVAETNVDTGNIALTGFSMGGVGVWSIASAHPDMFSRIAPCSGSPYISTRTLSALSTMPVWTFVGTADTVVKPQTTIDFISQLSQINDNAKITEFEGAAHTDVPALAYLDEDLGLIDWLIGKQ